MLKNKWINFNCEGSYWNVTPITGCPKDKYRLCCMLICIMRKSTSLVVNTVFSSDLWLSDVLPSHIGSLSQNSVSELVQQGRHSLVSHFTWCCSGTASVSSHSNEWIKLFFTSSRLSITAEKKSTVLQCAHMFHKLKNGSISRLRMAGKGFQHLCYV